MPEPPAAFHVVDKQRENPSFHAELGAALHAAIPTRVPTTKRS